jgi:hypothetical protein
MIKTLRITSIIAVVLAVFFVLPAVFGVRGDEQREQFLNSAGVIEKFKESKGDKVGDRGQEISPLVKQAEAFALYLSPPPPPQPIVSEPSRSQSPPQPKATSPKFKLVGTSYYALHPELSLALIDEPGKGLHWVRQFGKVGHLIIEQVKDGLVVVRDGQSTFELVAERQEKRSLLKKNLSSDVRISSGEPPWTGAEVQVSAEEETALGEEVGAERRKALSELDAMLHEQGMIQADVEPGDTNLGPKPEEVTTVRKRPSSNLENMRITAREARKLGRLGRRLKDVQQVPNRAEGDRTGSDANLIEPNSSTLNLNEPNLNDVNNPG